MTVDAGRYTVFRAVPPEASVSVFEVGTSTLVTLYTDKSSGATAANPTVADEFGTVNFFAVPGDYDLLIPVFSGDAEERVTITVPPDPTESWPG